MLLIVKAKLNVPVMMLVVLAKVYVIKDLIMLLTAEIVLAVVTVELFVGVMVLVPVLAVVMLLMTVMLLVNVVLVLVLCLAGDNRRCDSIGSVASCSGY
jgi:hypothetical protein